MQPGPGPGHYTILGAKGSGADLFWTGEGGQWVTDQNQAYLYGSVQAAQRTGIVGLPAGYKPVLIPATVEVEPHPPPGGNGDCTC